MVRRMSVRGKYSESDIITEKTNPLLLLFTYLCFFYLIDVVADRIALYLPEFVPEVFVMGLLIVVSYVAFITFQEMLFRDLLAYGALISFNQAVKAENSRFKEIYIQLATIAAKNSRLGRDFPSELNWLRRTELRIEGDHTMSNKIIFNLSIGIVLVFFLAIWAGVAFLLERWVATLIVLAATIFVSIPVNFLYSRYGLTPFKSSRRARMEAMVLLLGFVFAALLFI